MENLRLKYFLLCVIISFAGAGSGALADWDPGGFSKMHFPQEPDPNGWDVCFCCQWVADDFKCAESAPLTDIHFWISWKQDLVGDINDWDIAIWSDKPSEPNMALWQWNGQGDVTIRPYGTGDQGWACPSGPLIERPDHNDYYQVNITNIPPEAEPFVQQQGTIYWLVIKVSVLEPASVVGWKTSLNSPPGVVWGGPAHWSRDLVGWSKVDTGQAAPELHDMAFVITGAQIVTELEYGDAPEGGVAYPSSGTIGSFPTCRTISPPGHIQHNNGGAYFGPSIDLELDGDAGLCPPPVCFPPYDADECFMDGDAGLIIPEPYTIDGANNVVTCPQSLGTALGTICYPAVWGSDIDIEVHNHMPSGADAYVNVFLDWNQDGKWAGAASCGAAATPERVLVNHPVPNPYDGLLSALNPPNFVIGPNAGYVWARFTITERPVNDPNWDGSGTFEDGESEDYLLRIDAEQLDFGDAPDPTYPTLLESNGARHVIVPSTPGVYLGDSVDAEPNGQPSSGASGDDYDENDDEDGVVFTSPVVPGQTATIDVNANVDGFLDAWVDFSGDGSWLDTGDQICVAEPLLAGLNSLAFDVPYSARPGITFARFRFSTVGGLACDGQAPDGEVEDYRVDIRGNPGIKWMQLPDITAGGVAIQVDDMRWLADDFECTSYGLITDVHLWGSWKYDEAGEITRIHLSIHSDDPCGPSGYSEPNDELLWEKDFFPAEFSERLYAMVPGDPCQWWWDPADQNLIPPDHTEIWQIDIYIEPWDAFLQEGDPCNPVVYWLDVQVDTNSGEFGWTTRQWPDYYNDDAVFDRGSELPHIWKELRYPQGHPYEANSIDMAFVLTGTELKRPLKHLKWSQPPVEIDPTVIPPTYCGWDEPSLAWDPCDLWKIVADDFRCLGEMPITSVHWWGSHFAWEGQEPAYPRPAVWRIGFWSNVPADPDRIPPYSYPEKLLWQIEVPADRVSWDLAGDDYHPAFAHYDTCFQYHVELKPEEYFWQAEFETQENVFWISITAVYAPDIYIVFPWGWKTRPWHWMDDGVWFELYEPPQPGVAVDPNRLTLIKDLSTRESSDLTFELGTDPNWIKSEQPFSGIRHWWHHEDELSTGTIELQSGQLVKHVQYPDLVSRMALGVDATTDGTWPAQVLADDFQCTATGPITDIRIWGAWYVDELPNGDPTKVVFTLSLHEDIPADDSPTGYSLPGRLLWTKKFDPGDFSAGIHAQGLWEGWYVPCTVPPEYHSFADSQCWQYDFHIEPQEAFRQQEGTIYWLAVQAKPLAPEVRFGWKASADHWNDKAVWGQGNQLYPGPWNELSYPAGHTYEGQPMDLAFEIAGYEQGFNVVRLVADEWSCETEAPVTAAVWWGSYIGYGFEACTGATIPPEKPDYFQLTIWDDVPADDPCNLYPFSHPNDIIWEYKALDYDQVFVGYDKHPHGKPNEPVFRYSVRLPEQAWFFQEDSNSIYWFSVAAVYDLYQPEYQWGWTNHKYTSNDFAVAGYPDPCDTTPEWKWEDLYDQTDMGEDMSFVLLSLVNHTISGTVTFEGSGLADVNMVGLPGTPITDANGNYSAEVDSRWSGVVTPTKAEYTFAPASITYSYVTSDQLNQDYTASLVRYTISGKVTYEGAGLADVNMVGLPGTPLTDANGEYSVQVDSGWSGIVMPTKGEYIFEPNSVTYTNVTSDYTNQDYTATLPYPECWGYLTQCHGDSDNTGDVKGSDFLALKSSWYNVYPDPNYDPCADFDRNGEVKGSDFLILKGNWYQTVDPNCPPGGVWPPQP